MFPLAAPMISSKVGGRNYICHSSFTNSGITSIKLQLFLNKGEQKGCHFPLGITCMCITSRGYYDISILLILSYIIYYYYAGCPISNEPTFPLENLIDRNCWGDESRLIHNHKDRLI